MICAPRAGNRPAGNCELDLAVLRKEFKNSNRSVQPHPHLNALHRAAFDEYRWRHRSIRARLANAKWIYKIAYPTAKTYIGKDNLSLSYNSYFSSLTERSLRL